MRGFDVSASDGADTSVSGEDHNGGKRGLEGFIQVGETFDVKHVDFIDEEDSRDQFGDSVVDVFVDDFVDFLSELLSDFSFLGLHDLAHHGDEIVAALRSGIGHVKILQSDILDDVLFLVGFTLGDRDVLLGL